MYTPTSRQARVRARARAPFPRERRSEDADLPGLLRRPTGARYADPRRTAGDKLCDPSGRAP
jgi:hypothetical protein